MSKIISQIRALQEMTVAELREKHLELFGSETRNRHKSQLLKRLAWRIQELEYGGLSERAKRRAEEIASDMDARHLPPRTPKNGDGRPHETLPFGLKSKEIHPAPGTVLTREYRGEIHQAIVLDEGFEYRGKVYKSLSGVARAITGGTNWSGFVFFGLKKRKSNGR